MSSISSISTYFPDHILTNGELATCFTDWPERKIYQKTGILERRICGPKETAADLGVAAAERLFTDFSVDRSDIDFLIFCTQSPDYFLPTTACVMQDRLGLPMSAGAIDINQGCSGFVYGLSVANGLIESGVVNSVLLVTADTYSKYINPRDKSVRTLFGDGATATLITVSDEGQKVDHFIFGTDGSGAGNLIVPNGGHRSPKDRMACAEETDEFGNSRTSDNLYMNGGEVMGFTLSCVPKAIDGVLHKSGLGMAEIDYFVFHQANKFMLDALQRKLKLPNEKVPRCFEKTGNTVSSTIPITLAQLKAQHCLLPGDKVLLCGFGVGYSWAACLWSV